MRNCLGIALFCVVFFLSSASRASELLQQAEFEEFAKQIVDINSRQAKEEYLLLLHPSCPAPEAAYLDYVFKQRWLADEYDVRINPVEKNFDLTKLDFKVTPEAALEFQVWIIKADGKKTELLKAIPVARHEGSLKIADYPCFQPK